MKENWTCKKLGDIATFSRGLTFAKGDVADMSSKKVLRSNNIDLNGHSLNFDDVACLNEDFVIPDEKKLHKGDIFICMSNGSTQHLGKVAFIEKDLDYAFGGFMGAIHPNQSETNPKFVFYACLSSEYRRFLASVFNGVNINNLKWSDLSKFSIPVPPLETQSRIVSELDLLQSIINKQQAQLKELDKLAQAVFYDMFGDPVENEKGWEVKRLEEIVAEDCPISYGIVQPGEGVANGVPVVRPVNMTNTFVFRFGLKQTTKKISDSYRRTILKGNEILLCVRGTTGLVALASEELVGCNVTRGIAPIECNEHNDRWFVYYQFLTKGIQQYITDFTKGIALKQINMKDVREIPFIVPPLSLQQSFATKIESIEKQKSAISQSITETQKLFDYTMDKYFG